MSGKEVFTYSFERLWFLDVYGHILCHLPYRGGLGRVPLCGLLLKGYVALPYPVPAISVPAWLGHSPFPLDVPALEMRAVDNGLVTFRETASGEYLSINVQGNETVFVEQASDWERFLPVTHDVLQGLILMRDDTVGAIRLPSGEKAGRFAFPYGGSAGLHSAELGDVRFDLRKSRDSLGVLGRLAVGETVTVPLVLQGNKGDCAVTVTRLKPIAREG